MSEAGKPGTRVNRSLSSIGRQISFRQPVRPFVSSTFVDFFEERDHLVKRVFPQLDSLCHERGTHFSPVDLRWGISEEQTQAGNVISLCLDYINSCSPFFICLLGERYGSHRPGDAEPLSAGTDPEREGLMWLDKNYLVAAANGHHWILQEAYQGCSVTELEIIQAAYLNDSQHCRFYFRDVRHIEDKFTNLSDEEREKKLQVYRCENAETELRVRDLKRRIINKGLPVQFFRTTEELGEKVLQDWKSIVSQLFPPLHDIITDVDGEQFREWTAHEAYAETRRRVFVQTPHTDDIFEQLDAHAVLALEKQPNDATIGNGQLNDTTIRQKSMEPAKEKVASIVTLVGERGCGKTAIVANWAQQFRRSYPGLKVISHFVGSSALSVDITSFLRRVTYELRGEYVGKQNETSGDAEDMSNFHHICEAFVAAVAMGPCVLVLDGIDELSGTLGQSMHQVKEMAWLPVKMPPQCKVILTTVRSDLTYKTLSQRRDAQVLLVPLFAKKEQKSSMITSSLAIHCKCLDQSQLEKVVTSKLSDRPLFLSILANELRVCGTYGNLDEVIDQYLEAATFRDLWKCVIHRWIKDYGWTTDGRSTSVSSESSSEDASGWVADVLRLISCSRHGLGEPELLTLLRMRGYTGRAEVTAFDFALFRSATFDALAERPGGLMSFFHQHLREAVEHSLLGMISGTAGMPDSPNSSAVNFLSAGLNRQKRACHEALARYFWGQPHGLRRTGELPWQLEKCGDIQGLFSILTEPEVFLMMCQDSIQSVALKLDLLRYWQRLNRSGYSIAEANEKMVMKAVDERKWEGTKRGGKSRTEPTADVNEQGSMQPACGNQAQKLSVIDEDDASASAGNSPTHRISRTQDNGDAAEAVAKASSTTSQKSALSEEHKTSLSADLMRGLAVSSSPGVVNGGASDVDGGSSSDTDEDGEVWEDARDGTEPNSDEEEIFYEFKPEDRCMIAVLAMHAGKFLAERSCFMHSERLLQLAHSEMNTKFPLSTPEQLFLVKVEENLADLHRFQLHRMPAKKFYHKALNTLSNIAADETDGIYRLLLEIQGRLLNHLGFMAVKEHTKNVQEAETALKKASRCMREANSIAGLATAQFILGLVQIKKSDYVTAEECLHEALNTREKWYGKSHPHVAEVLNELGGLLCDRRNLQRFDTIAAEALFRRALHIRTQSYGRDHLLVGTTLFHLGKLLKSSGSQQCKTEAVTLLGRAQDIRTTHLGANHFLTKAVRQALKDVQKQLSTGEYDYAPVKQPDRRTKERPYSGLSWHEGDLMGFDKHARAKSALSGVERKTAAKQQERGPRSAVVGDDGPEKVATGLKPRSMSDTNASGAGQTGQPSVSSRASTPGYNSKQREEMQSGNSSRGRGWRQGGKTQRPRSGNGSLKSGQSPDRTQDNRRTASAHTPGRTQNQFDKRDSLQSLCLIPRHGTNSEGISTASHQGGHPPQNPESVMRRFGTWSAGTHSTNQARSARGRAQSSSGSRDPRPLSSTSQVSHASHRSRCDIPAAFQMHPSNDRTIRGPHSQIQAVLGEPACPRPVQPKVLHTSAWWHEPGRYPKTPSDIYPPRRHQRRPASVPAFESVNRFSVLDSMEEDGN